MTQPPRRFFWLTAGAAAVLLLLSGLWVMRAGWEHVAETRWRVAIAAAHARGERVTVDDFNRRPRLPDDQNAAVLLKAAAAGVRMNPAQSAFDDRYDSHVPLTPADLALLDTLVRDNAGAISLAQQAADRPAADWGPVFGSSVMSWAITGLNGQRELATLLMYAALDRHARGDDAGTVSLLRALFAQADALEQYGPTIVTHLTAAAIAAVGYEVLEEVTDTLNAPAPAAHALVERLVDDRSAESGWAEAWEGERVFSIELRSHPQWGVSSPELLARLTGWILKPMFELDALRIFQFDSAAFAAGRCSTYSQAAARLPRAGVAVGTAIPPSAAFARVLSDIAMPSYISALAGQHFRQVTQRRVTAIRVAIRMYELDHDGRDPQRLAELVPVYLPAVPVDPFAPDGHVLRFIDGPRESEAIYSVGFDGRDDGGAAFGTTRPKNTARQTPWSGRDAVFFVHPRQ